MDFIDGPVGLPVVILFLGFLVGILVLLGFLWKFFKQKNMRKPPPTIYQGAQRSQKAPSDIADSPSQTPENTADNLNDSSDLKLLLEKLLEEVQSIRESLNSIEDILQGQVPSQPKNSSSHSVERVVEKSPQGELIHPALQEFSNLYNTGEPVQLRERYPQNHRIGVVNADERHRNLNEPPIFKNHDAGDFLAFYIEAKNLHAVVPYHGLVLQDHIYSTGAFGKVFDCHPDFDHQKRYHVKITKPAFFEPDSTQQQWALKKKGVLALTPVE